MHHAIELLPKLPLFTTLPSEAIAALVEHLQRGTLGEGEILFRKGDPSGALILIESGAVEVYLEDGDNRELLRRMGPGEALGEMSLIDEEPRSATVVALSPIEYYVLYRQDFLDVVNTLPPETIGVLRDIAANLRMHHIDLLKRLPMFTGLPDNVLRKIAVKLTGQSIDEGEVLIQKGDIADSCYVITKGRFKIATVGPKGEELILNTSGPGEAIGEMALIDDAPRSATVTAQVPSEVFQLSREDFLAVLRDYPSLSQEMMRRFSARLRFSTTYIVQAIDFARHIAEGDYDFVKRQIESSRSTLKPENMSDEARAAELLTAFFQMVEGVQQREEALQQQVRQLTIQIDQSKRKEEFESVTKTDFFADLKAQAAKLREERFVDEEDDSSRLITD